MTEWAPSKLPEDLESEQSILATCCAPGNERVAGEICFEKGLEEEDFVHPAHKAVYSALRNLVANDMEVTPLTLKAELEALKRLGQVGGYLGLVDLLNSPEVGRPQILADILRKKTKQRKLYRLGAQLAKAACEESEEPTRLVESTIQGLFNLSVTQEVQRPIKSIQEIGPEAFVRLADEIEGKRESGMSTGFGRFDALTQGFVPGQLIILAARPGIGKSALALNWTMKLAKRGRRGAFFCLEMGDDELYRRVLSDRAQVDIRATKGMRGEDRARQVEKLREAMHEVHNLPVSFCDQATITVPGIRQYCKAEEARCRQRFEFVIVDYLQLVSSPENSRGAKQNEAVRVAEISRGLKLFAKDAGMPVVVLSQLNREVEHRSGGRPQLSDLRDSGAIEQDADMVVFLHRDMKPKPDVVDEEVDEDAELIVAKCRNGKLGTIPMKYRGRTFTYYEVERETQPPTKITGRQGNLYGD